MKGSIYLVLCLGLLFIALVVVTIVLSVNRKSSYINKTSTSPSAKPSPSTPTYINALDGNGEPVLWWFVMKLPSSVLTMKTGYWGEDILTEGDLKDNWYHSNDAYSFMRKIKNKYENDGTYFEFMSACGSCKDPDCTGDDAPQGLKDLRKKHPLSVKNRGKGLCYLYADSKNPQLRFFTQCKTKDNKPWSCLGQGANDPLSKTLRQIFQSQKDTQWSFWTDQIYQSSDSWFGDTPFPGSIGQNQSTKNTVYPHPHAGCGRPGAHSKGALAFNDTGGFFLQSSFPMYPDFSFKGQPGFVKLGCQLDNNVNFAQSCFCCSLPRSEFSSLETILKSAMLCSYRSPTCDPEASDSTNSGVGINTDLLQCQSTNLDSGVKDSLSYGNFMRGADSKDITLQISGGDSSVKETVTVVAKSQYNMQPPWMIVANALKSDLSVLSWWSPDYGAPALCKDTRYDDATNAFCLSQGPDISSGGGLNIEQPLWPFLDDSKNPGDLIDVHGHPKYNIEMILSLKFEEDNIPGINDVLTTNPKKPLTDKSIGFFTLGGVFDAGNHIKLGLSTPSDKGTNENWVVFGDMNHEGYPGTTDCSKSQFGRGGLFFGLKNQTLWQSLESSINKVCACTNDSINSNRFCGQGAYPGLLWWDKGASTKETSTGHKDISGVHQPWYFRQMKVSECNEHGVPADKCIGTGYMEFGDFYNKGFTWPEYPSSNNPSTTTSYWDSKPNAWKWENK